jgi:hypothetical protein
MRRAIVGLAYLDHSPIIRAPLKGAQARRVTAGSAVRDESCSPVRARGASHTGERKVDWQNVRFRLAKGLIKKTSCGRAQRQYQHALFSRRGPRGASRTLETRRVSVTLGHTRKPHANANGRTRTGRQTDDRRHNQTSTPSPRSGWHTYDISECRAFTRRPVCVSHRHRQLERQWEGPSNVLEYCY